MLMFGRNQHNTVTQFPSIKNKYFKKKKDWLPIKRKRLVLGSLFTFLRDEAVCRFATLSGPQMRLNSDPLNEGQEELREEAACSRLAGGSFNKQGTSIKGLPWAEISACQNLKSPYRGFPGVQHIHFPVVSTSGHSLKACVLESTQRSNGGEKMHQGPGSSSRVSWWPHPPWCPPKYHICVTGERWGKKWAVLGRIMSEKNRKC